ncbi:MAG: ATP-binding response regulator [Chloroflexota bacterium]
MKILIVEDEATDRLMLRSAVQHLGHECLVASSGAQGWELFGTQRPDVVISDWRMPGVDGVELCRRIRADEWSSYTPFIFVTGLTDREHALTGMEIGADDCLTKPLNVSELRVRLLAAGRLKRAEGRVIEHTAALESAIRQLEAEAAERKRVEAALRESDQRLHSVVGNAPVILFAVDAGGTFTFFEGSRLKVLGLDPAQIVGRAAGTWNPEGGNIAEEVPRALRGETFRTVVNALGTVFDTFYSPMLDVDGRVIGAIGVAVDASERQAADRMKDEFLSVVSHELRTPLTAIRGSLGVLTGGLVSADSEQGGRMLEIALTNTTRLIHLINDLLDVERMKSGIFSLNREDCDVSDLMRTAADGVRGMAEEVGILLDVRPYPMHVSADPHRLVQVLTNVLGNAIKFSPHGATVSLSAHEAHNELILAVTDAGRGIPADKLDVIFQRFEQVEVNDSRQKGGTGLGLAISRSIVETHGGRIWAESTLGQGSTFRISLPAPNALSASSLAA